MVRRCACVVAFLAITAGGQGTDEIPKHRAEQIRKAAPAKARVKPARARRVLVWNTPAHLMAKDPHKGYCIPYGAYAMKTLGRKTGAFTPVVSDDPAVFLPASLKQFDAIVLNNASGAWIMPDDATAEKLKAHGDKKAIELMLRKSLLDFVRGGGGIVAYHYALGGNRHWPEFREMIGATVAGHPWNEEIGVLVEEPAHPLAAAFGGKKKFRIADEIFQFSKPYARDKLRVLLSLDVKTTNMGVKWINRKDNDFALAWVKAFGKGRVFYTALGHRTEIYWNATILQFYLDGIQFATGDLKAPKAPRATTRPAPNAK
jgi:type 1 glutamine amidotransferase